MLVCCVNEHRFVPGANGIRVESVSPRRSSSLFSFIDDLSRDRDVISEAMFSVLGA